MRLLLDEPLPVELAVAIAGHQVSTVRAEGWSGTRNGKLLALAATRFDAFLTADRNLEFPQNLAKLPIAAVALVSRTNRLRDLAPLLPALSEALMTLVPQRVRRVGA